VWLIRVENETAYVQMLGACGGCAAAHLTLKNGIEAVIRKTSPKSPASKRSSILPQTLIFDLDGTLTDPYEASPAPTSTRASSSASTSYPIATSAG